MSETTNTDSSPKIEMDDFIGTSKAIQEVKKIVAVVTLLASTSPEKVSTVSIRGESGVGKEHIAKAIHDNGPRKDETFHSIDCGTMTDTLAESALFGHKKGAFDGADSPRLGAFRSAHRGTLFLDEVANLSDAVQRKLLRALQKGQVRPVGEDELRPVDVQVICATNEDLEVAVRSGRFRRDLYERLVKRSIYIPPLRDRTEDIRPLITYYERRLQTEHEKIIQKITVAEDAIRYLEKDRLPGNVRSIQNFLENALVTALTKVEPEAWQDGKLEVEIGADILDSQEEVLSGEAGVVPTSVDLTLKEQVSWLIEKVVQLERRLAQHGIKDSQEPLEPYRLSAEDDKEREGVEAFLEACEINSDKIDQYNVGKQNKKTYEALLDTLILVKKENLSQEALKNTLCYTKNEREEECWNKQSLRQLLNTSFPERPLDTNHPLYDASRSERDGVTIGDFFKALRKFMKSYAGPLSPTLDN